MKAINMKTKIISFAFLALVTVNSAFGLTAGDRIQVTQSAGVNVRQSAGGTAYANGQPYGALGVITGSSQNAPINGTGTVYTWWYVDFDSGQDGWVATTGFSAVAPVAPTQVAPGNSSSPGLQISTLTPTISWNAALGANGYGVYVEDVATSTLVYNIDSVGNVTSVTLPSGTLVAGHNYVWNMRSSDSAGYTYCTTHFYFYTQSAAPTISSVSPNPATGANSAQTLNVYGSGFVSGAQVKLAWPAVGVVSAGSQTFSATFISSSQLQISPTYANDPGTWTAQVINPGSVTSSTFSFAVQAPFPVIASLSPPSATAGGSAFTLTVNGTTFNQSSVVRWNGVNLTTTPNVSGGLTTYLTAQVPAGDIVSAGTAQVTVYNPSPGGGISGPASFTINGGTPTITSVSPNPATGANSAQTLTVNGSGFVSPAQVKLSYPAVGVVSAGSQTFSATFISSSQLQISPTYANDPGTWTAQVINPGNITSSTYNFAVQAPFPVITSLSPSSATAGGSAFTLTVNGTTFNQSSVVQWNGTSLTTSHTVSSGMTTAISATIPASDIASAGSATVTVFTPSPGGGTASGSTFTINAGTPSISSVSPNPSTGANSAQTLNVYGSGFVSPAQVKLAWPAVGVVSAGNQTFSATFISSSQLQISPTYANDPGTWTAQVINPGSITSSTFNFAVQAPLPVITSLSPSSATAGGSAFTLTVNGTTFDQSSVVQWNGTSLTTSHTVNSGLTTAISATIPASDIASGGSATVTVFTPSPGGGTSVGATLTIGNTQTEVLGADFNADALSINWQQETSGSRSFLIIKATQGDNPNSFLPSNMSGVPVVTSSFTFGLYAYADPDERENPSSKVTDPSNSSQVIADAQAAANSYYNIAKSYFTTGHLAPALDLEDEQGTPPGGFNSPNDSIAGYPKWTWSEIAEWIAAWTKQLQQDAPSLPAPILYMPQGYAQNISPQLINSYLSSPVSYRLWVVDINDSPNIDPNPVIGSWSSWAIEQYDWTGATPPGDLDALNSATTLSSLEISGGGGGSSPIISSPILTGTTFTLSVPTQIGFNYTLEYKNSFSDANWTAVQTIGGTGGTITLTDTGATGGSRLYHVRVQ